MARLPQSAVQSISSSSSPTYSLPSEPPDIANLFSSYVYESPESLNLPPCFESFPVVFEQDDESIDTQDSSESDGLQAEDSQTSKGNDALTQNYDNPYYGPCTKAHSCMTKSFNLSEQAHKEPSRIHNYANKEEYDNRSLVSAKSTAKRTVLSPPSVTVRSNNEKQGSCQEHFHSIDSFQNEQEELLLGSNFSDKNACTRHDKAKVRSITEANSVFQAEIRNCGSAPIQLDRLENQSDKAADVRIEHNQSLLRNNCFPPKRKISLKKLLVDDLLIDTKECETSPILSATENTWHFDGFKSKMVVHRGSDKEIKVAAVEKSPIKENTLRPLAVTEGNKDDKNAQLKLSASSSCTNDIDSKENASVDGFISTRKRAASLSEAQMHPQKPSLLNVYKDVRTTTAPILKKKDALSTNEDCLLRDGNGSLVRKKNKQIEDANRSPLADKTNYGNTTLIHEEIPGHWRYPQNKKPSSGPQLKQLHLGRWFHRVNS